MCGPKALNLEFNGHIRIQDTGHIRIQVDQWMMVIIFNYIRLWAWDCWINYLSHFACAYVITEYMFKSTKYMSEYNCISCLVLFALCFPFAFCFIWVSICIWRNKDILNIYFNKKSNNTYNGIETKAWNRNVFWPRVETDHFTPTVGPQVPWVSSVETLYISSCQKSTQIRIFTVYFLAKHHQTQPNKD